MNDKEQRTGQEEPLPRIQTMQPAITLAPPPHLERWIAEFKWDGVRALVYIDRNNNSFEIVTREGNVVTKRFTEFHEGLARLAQDRRIILDSEIVFRFGKKGDARGAIARVNQNPPAIPVPPHLNPLYCHLFVFDVVFDEVSLRRKPLIERNTHLTSILPMDFQNTYGIGLTPYWDGTNEEATNKVEKLGYEGVVFKRRESHYVQGHSREWLKLRFP